MRPPTAHHTQRTGKTVNSTECGRYSRNITDRDMLPRASLRRSSGPKAIRRKFVADGSCDPRRLIINSDVRLYLPELILRSLGDARIDRLLGCNDVAGRCADSHFRPERRHRLGADRLPQRAHSSRPGRPFFGPGKLLFLNPEGNTSREWRRTTWPIESNEATARRRRSRRLTRTKRRMHRWLRHLRRCGTQRQSRLVMLTRRHDVPQIFPR